MTDYTVLNPLPMEEVLDMLYGNKENVNLKILKVVKKMVLFGTLNVNLDSTMSDVVFVLLIVLLDGLISGFLVKNLNHMEEVSDMVFLLDYNA